MFTESRDDGHDTYRSNSDVSYQTSTTRGKPPGVGIIPLPLPLRAVEDAVMDPRFLHCDGDGSRKPVAEACRRKEKEQ